MQVASLFNFSIAACCFIPLTKLPKKFKTLPPNVKPARPSYLVVIVPLVGDDCRRPYCMPLARDRLAVLLLAFAGSSRAFFRYQAGSHHNSRGSIASGSLFVKSAAAVAVFKRSTARATTSSQPTATSHEFCKMSEDIFYSRAVDQVWATEYFRPHNAWSSM